MPALFISAKYDVKTITVDYARSDGKHLLRTGGTIAWRFNNPGNIRPAQGTKMIMGAIGVGTTKGNGSFLIFASYEDGRAQKKALLRRKYNDRNFYTMLAGVPDKHGKLVQGYAPKSDNNDPVSYAQAISDHTGLSVETRLSDLTDAQLDHVLDAMEKKEGFDGKKETRSEHWLDTTGVTISDGAAPKSGLPVKIKIGEKTFDHKTSAAGELPIIAHSPLGEKVEIHIASHTGTFEKRLEFIMGQASNAFVLFHDLISFEASSQPKEVQQKSVVKSRQPIRYTVRARDTLAKLAKRFDCSVSSILELNPAIKDASKIYEGQVVSIYGSNPPTAHEAKAFASARPALPARSKKGTGAPLAIVRVDQRAAPWMAVAIEEGKRWGGKNEKLITRERNYHREIDTIGNLGNVPWCASFVNFCLKESNTPHEASASSQFANRSRKFIKIKRPVYGALLVMQNFNVKTNKFTGSGHVTFVYAKVSDTIIAAIGGNQGHTVKISPYKTIGASSPFMMGGKEIEQRFHGFYIPASYAEYAEAAPELDTVDIMEANENLLGIISLKKSYDESTR
jgi:uncharacterized protein (TIGR02594 family)